MKHKQNITKLFAAVVILLLVSSCDIVDKFDTFPVDIPISFNVQTSGSTSPMNSATSFCLSDLSSSYNDYRNDIESISFLEASFRTDSSMLNSDLVGNIVLKLMDSNGNQLFIVTMQNVKPADYVGKPYTLVLTSDMIDAMNAYIAVSGNQCFQATMNVTVTQGNAPYVVKGIVDMIFNSKVKL